MICVNASAYSSTGLGFESILSKALTPEFFSSGFKGSASTTPFLISCWPATNNLGRPVLGSSIVPLIVFTSYSTPFLSIVVFVTSIESAKICPVISPFSILVLTFAIKPSMSNLEPEIVACSSNLVTAFLSSIISLERFSPRLILKFSWASKFL